MKAEERIIVALDVNNLQEIEMLVEQLHPYVGAFKVGLEAITAIGGPIVVKCIHEMSGEVFYDGKFCDIPHTIAEASQGAAALNVRMFNVHASSGFEAMSEAVKNRGNSSVLAVTVLTSLSGRDVRSIFSSVPDRKVEQLAGLAEKAGCQGVICSPRELPFLKNYDFEMKVTPGVRPEWASKGDQKRVRTPKEAIEEGATHLVIGRPITDPPKEIGSSLDAISKILSEIEEAEAS